MRKRKSFSVKRADGADVDDVAGVLVVELAPGKDVDAVVVAALEDRQLAGLA